MRYKLDGGKTYCYFFISHFDLMQDWRRSQTSPLKHATNPVISWWTSPGAPTSHSRTGQGCLGTACLEAEISSGISLWDAENPHMEWGTALGTAVSTASTLVSQMLLSHLLSPAHGEKELCVLSPHTQEYNMCCSWHNPWLWICLYLLKPRIQWNGYSNISNGYSVTSCKIRSYFLNREQLWANFWILVNHMKTF